ncbi:uncharacterized protein BDZ99DRAFT_45448 [Mytilinidion resinicola]|uniref:Uncharacterized protein n=1 Tax=Mytilinidion resinicola TaxID=574789 RepID=A0A6A6YJW7_9PEZI|nr:uncharacterized protein BDZ99DRAFT_45448 [Mytilinidion resinicola]KAF2809101.1 hypothetical protein BDZ99DRAFT_45448 [Mytilinidion resinicola]
MPSHLQQFLIHIDKGLEEWEAQHAKEYTATNVRPTTLLKCPAEGQLSVLQGQIASDLMRQFPDLLQRWGIFQAVPPGSDITNKSDQIVIPIRITKPSVYITQTKESPDRKSISLDYAIFCAAGQSAFISDGVSFVAWMRRD